jgi:hypothetical protein
MSFIKWIKSFIKTDKKQEEKPVFQVKHNHKIVPAFISGGVQYFQFEDVFNAHSGRGFAIHDFYNELEMRCTRDFLVAHTTAVKNALSDPKKIDIYKINKLNVQLMERLEMVIDIEIFYKLCSVIFFDANEEPYGYDFKYNLQKIAKWKTEGLNTFFLQQPVSKLIPLTSFSDQDLEVQMKMGKAMTKEHLESIFMMLSESDMSKEFYKRLQSQVNTD